MKYVFTVFDWQNYYPARRAICERFANMPGFRVDDTVQWEEFVVYLSGCNDRNSTNDVVKAAMRSLGIDIYCICFSTEDDAR